MTIDLDELERSLPTTSDLTNGEWAKLIALARKGQCDDEVFERGIDKWSEDTARLDVALQEAQAAHRAEHERAEVYERALREIDQMQEAFNNDDAKPPIDVICEMGDKAREALEKGAKTGAPAASSEARADRSLEVADRPKRR